MRKGEFICIIGEIGSGKSSLLSSILNDLKLVDNDTQRPKIQINGTLSYVQQDPWLQSLTIRDNILFG